MADPQKLRALIASSTGQADRPVRIPLPMQPEVVYAGPNPDGSRKRCGNCYKFVASAGACVEVAGRVEPGAVCNLHVFGLPQELAPAAKPPQKLGAAEAGLIPTPLGMGTSCDLCRHYRPDQRFPDVGLCQAVADPLGMPPSGVDALGCCARWSPKTTVR